MDFINTNFFKQGPLGPRHHFLKTNFGKKGTTKFPKSLKTKNWAAVVFCSFFSTLLRELRNSESMENSMDSEYGARARASKKNYRKLHKGLTGAVLIPIEMKLYQKIDLVALSSKTILLVPNEAWKGSKNPIFGLRRQKNREQKVQGHPGIHRAPDRHSTAVLKEIWNPTLKPKTICF